MSSKNVTTVIPHSDSPLTHLLQLHFLASVVIIKRVQERTPCQPAGAAAERCLAGALCKRAVRVSNLIHCALRSGGEGKHYDSHIHNCNRSGFQGGAGHARAHTRAHTCFEPSTRPGLSSLSTKADELKHWCKEAGCGRGVGALCGSSTRQARQQR